jgi:ABC-2 type transport system ATP-binding protein
MTSHPSVDVPLLEVRDLRKVYPRGRGRTSEVQAVRGVSFRIRSGSCFGLLGPNGAGKSTTLSMIEGILERTSGEILYRGEPAGARLRQRAGIQFQETALQDYLRVRETLEMFRSFYDSGLSIDEVIRLCDLGDFVTADVHEISGGQRQRLLLAVALVNDPELLFLDEPTTGLDPGARRQFWGLVRTLKSQGRTIVLTTHYMEEASELCDEIVILDQGRIIAEGTPQGLLKEHFGEQTANLEDLFLKLTGKRILEASV